MKKNRVIAFESRERILAAARKYVESIELFFERADKAVPLLLKALKHADADFKREIMLVLGSFAKDQILWPLFEMMTDPSEEEEVRHDASIHLSVIAPFLKDPQPLVARLLEEIESSDPERRLHATSAIGWQGNSEAAIPLIERLYDSDQRVQQTAVNALCNLKDDRILDLLVDRLDRAAREQKRAILFNLWRFHSKAEKVRDIYLRYLRDEDPDLRFDALVGMGPITDARDAIEAYRTCLKDSDSRVRELALKRLAEEGSDRDLEGLRPDVAALLDDPDMHIKQAALNVLSRIGPRRSL